VTRTLDDAVRTRETAVARAHRVRTLFEAPLRSAVIAVVTLAATFAA
jgi:hypothetical protein